MKKIRVMIVDDSATVRLAEIRAMISANDYISPQKLSAPTKAG
jgi:hypothetical protein